VLRAPTGLGFVIETKTSRYALSHLERTVAAARWLSRRRRRYARGVIPVVCLARACWVERVERGVLITSLDRLVATLRTAAAVPSPAAAA
jgi:hypothetical protein